VAYGVDMQTPTRRHRSSNLPVRLQRTIYPHEIDERHIEVLKLLSLTTNSNTSLSMASLSIEHAVEYSVFRKYLGYLRQSPQQLSRLP